MTNKSFILILFFTMLINYESFGQLDSLHETYKHTMRSVRAVAISPDGKYLAAVGKHNLSGGGILVWDLESESLILKKYNLNNTFRDVKFGNNGKYLYAARGAVIDIWNLKLKKKIHGFSCFGRVNAIDINYSNNLMVSGGTDKRLYIWDVENNKGLKRKFSRVKHNIHDVSISDDGSLVASAGLNPNTKLGVIEVRDIRSGKLLHSLDQNEGPLRETINTIDFSPNGKFLASGGHNGQVLLWDLDTGIPKQLYTHKNVPVIKLQFSKNEDILAILTREGQIEIWDILKAKRLRIYDNNISAINGLDLDQEDKFFISLTENKEVRIWNTFNYDLYKEIEHYVQSKLISWQQRGKYEKTTDYKQRVSVEAQQIKAQEYIQEAVNSLAENRVDWQAVTGAYDPDHETFRLILEGFDTLYVHVPNDQAEEFDQNIHQLKFKNTHYTITEEQEFVLVETHIFNPVNEQTYHYHSDKYLTFDPQQLELDLGGIAVNSTQIPSFTSSKSRRKPNQSTTQSNNSTKPIITQKPDIDTQLPKTNMDNPDAIAVIIGNSDYQKTKAVDFAINDAQSMRNYLVQVMGFKPGNIIYLENALYTDFKLVFGSKENHEGKLYNMIKPDLSDVFIFYSGHGAPGLKDHKAYFVPVESDPQYVELTGFPADVFYNNLAKLPARSVVVALDACFSGENIYENISPIIIKSKGALGLKDGALIASSQADQVSSWYNEKGHGMFTYFFLKAIHDKNADQNNDRQLTLKEIYQYIADQTEGVPYYARRLHGIEQVPVLKGQNPNRVLVEYK